MTRHSVKIATDFLHVDRHVDRRLAAINQHGHATRPRTSTNRRYIHDGALHVGQCVTSISLVRGVIAASTLAGSGPRCPPLPIL